MIQSVVPVVPVSKVSVMFETLSKVGFEENWVHNPGQGLMYGSAIDPSSGLEIHASESRGDGTGPVVIYFFVSEVDALAAKAGVTAEDQTWGTREFWLRDSDGNSYRFGQRL
jgi:uncharacterized glyoxalase superfamily protein PhnB